MVTEDFRKKAYLRLSRDKLRGSCEDIWYDAKTDQIEKIKDQYGIDITNKVLLRHLNNYGSLTIVCNSLHEIWDSAPDEATLDRLEAEELETARATMKIAKDMDKYPEMKEP